MEERSFHPIAELFPLLEGEEFERFVESIREHGQQVPILVMPEPDGRILDGRNRWRACQAVGITPRTRVYEGDPSEAVLFKEVASANIERRQLSVSQRATIAARFVNMARENDRGRRQERRRVARSVRSIRRSERSDCVVCLKNKRIVQEHHILPLGEYLSGEPQTAHYQTVFLCPNCHAILHEHRSKASWDQELYELLTEEQWLRMVEIIKAEHELSKELTDPESV